MAKNNFIKPWSKAKKDLGKTAVEAVVRGVGGVASAYAMNKFMAKLPDTVKKHKGALMFVLGTAGEVFIEQPHLKAGMQGIATAGLMQETIELVGDKVKPDISLQGIDAPANDSVDWDALRKKAEQDAMRGIIDDDPENMNGLNQDIYTNPAENL